MSTMNAPARLHPHQYQHHPSPDPQHDPTPDVLPDPPPTAPEPAPPDVIDPPAPPDVIDPPAPGEIDLPVREPGRSPEPVRVS